MKYSKTNHLPIAVLSQLNALNPAEYIPFYTEIQNTPYSSFHFFTDKGSLVSFMGIMPVSENTVELTSYTFPQFRRRGYFTHLLKQAMEELTFIPGIRILSEQKLNFPFIINTFSHQEYLMMLDKDCRIPVLPAGNTALLEYAYGESAETRYDFVLTENDIPVGILKITCEPSADTACLHHVKIRRHLRGRGYGYMLVSRALEVFRQKKNCDIVLHVTSTNTAATHLYQKLGFKIIQSLDYYQPELRDCQ